ncbi:transmembrane protein, putative (macronuclear) [Tetrahymena thermophila SB210]|uniref:Transmembrane protein, putative n=1 Tax=Tetrahymena thermophila (strain SB210) TaxID=312017 RepID=W7X9R4_TETTS|nr:transmembrane protein, putative [Tetrahymena thermophila SB210]EWS73143.1 transmembrane protein, putative [Tetrahymena thermophila SB210]|eukprot:XP_012654330.1 transmembrane protein, putative [Tetrahymena thermophila SB210]
MDLITIPQTNILIALTNNKYYSQSAIFYYIDIETNKIINVVELTTTIYLIKYVPVLNAIIGISSSTFYVFDIYTMNILQQSKVVDQIYSADNFIDNSIAVIASQKNIVVSYDIKEKKIINTYYSNSAVQNLKCLTLPNGEHVVIMNDASYIFLWDVDDGNYDFIQQVQTINQTCFAQYPNSYYVFASFNSTQLNLIDLNQYKSSNFTTVYALETLDILNNQTGSQNQNQTQIVQIIISQQNQLSHDYLVLGFSNGFQIIFQLPKEYDQQNFQLKMVEIFNVKFVKAIMPDNNLNLYISGMYAIYVVNYYEENNAYRYLLLFLPQYGNTIRYCVAYQNQEAYISSIDGHLAGTNDSGTSFLFYLQQQYPIYPNYFSAQLVSNSQDQEISYKLLNGGIMVFDVNNQQFKYYNVLQNQSWGQYQQYLVVKNTDHYAFVSAFYQQGNYSILVLNLNTQQAKFYQPSDKSVLSYPFVYSVNEQRIYATSYIGDLYIWDFNTTQIFKQKISNIPIIQILRIESSKYIIALDFDKNLIQISEQNSSIQTIYKFKTALTTMKYIDQVNLVFVGEQLIGNVYGFQFDQSISQYKLLIQLKAQQDQTILDISLTPITNLLFISGDSASIFFDIQQCLKNMQSCMKCSLSFYIVNNQEQYLSQNSYGQGTISYPFTTNQSILLSFLITQRYKKILVNVQEIKTVLYVSNKYPLELQQYILQFNFQNILQLQILSYFEDSFEPSIVYLEGDFSFNNFQSVLLGNITLIYNITQNQNCSLNFNSIINQVVLDNIQIQNNDLKNKDYCNNIKLINSQFSLQNTILDSKQFANLTFITSIGSSKVRLSNFSLVNSTLGLFSIFSEQSHTLLEVDNLTIYQNQCLNQSFQNQEQAISLFQAGKISFSKVNISKNYFCNMQIIQTVAQNTIQNLLFNLNEIQVFNNSFKTLSQSVLFSCLFSLLPQPDHQIAITNIQIYNNIIIQNQKIQNSQYFLSNMVQTSNIQNIMLSNINITDNHQIQFILSQSTINFNLQNFNCSYSDTYQEKNRNYPSSGCLSIQEVFNINISNLNVFQKVAHDSNLVDITNQKIEQTYILIQNSSFNNIILVQSQQYNQANPLIIKSSYQSNIIIENCTFSNNMLYGIPNSITLSSSGLQIINIVGNFVINNSKFLHLSSNSDINALYALSPNIQINLSIFENTLYQQDQGQASNNSENIISIKGGSINVKTQNLQINQSNFQKSLSYTGGFIFVTSYSKTLIISISDCEFSNSFTKLNGGVLFLDSIGSFVQLTLSTCQFKNIFLLNWQASLFYINQDTIGKNTENKSLISLNNVNFTDIYGNDQSSIFSLALSQLNITKSHYISNQNITFNEIIPLNQFNNFIPSTFISSFKSFIFINDITISNISDNYQLSSDHQIFINSQNSDISLTNCTISDIKMNLGGISQFTSDIVKIQNFQMHNIIFQTRNMLKRVLQYQKNLSCLRFINVTLTINQTNSCNIKCQYNCQGGFAFLDSSQLTLINSNFSDIQSENGGVIYIQDPNLNQIISNNTFQNNTSSQNGGAILIQSNQVQALFNMSIVQNYFLNNLAQNGKGGSIYFYSQNSIQRGYLSIVKNQILNNKAFIGGGIKYEGIIPTMSDNIVENNSAFLYGQNIFSYPTRLFLENSLELEKLNNQIQVQIDKIIITMQRSGASLPVMIFTLRNEYDDIMKFANTEDIQSSYIFLEIDPQTQFFQQFYLRGETKAYYNQETNSFQFKNIDLIGKPQSKTKIMVKSNLIRDINTIQLTDNYYFEIFVEILGCQMGQIIYKYNGFQECKICEQGTYSFDYNECYKCPNGADCLGGSKIVVEKGFWRKEENDDKILSCENLKENCQGGSFGNQICYRGHIGALCEECDINGVYWGQSYTKSGKYTCTQCSEIQYNMYVVVFVAFWTIVSMAVSIKSDSKKQTEIYRQELFQRIAQKSALKIKNQNSNNCDDYTSVLLNFPLLLDNHYKKR